MELEIADDDAGLQVSATRKSDEVPELVVTYARAPSNSPPHQLHNATPAHSATN